MTVYVQGTNLFGINYWRIGTPFDGGINDSELIPALLDTLSNRYLIDRDRVYGTGFSLGGFMTHLTACEQPDIFAAIASNSGTIADTKINACNSAKPTPVMHVHGTNDSVIFYNGGAFNLVISQFLFQGAQFVMNTWATVNNCDATPDSLRLPDIRNDGLTVDQFTYLNCADSTEVIHIRVNGFDHSWMQSINDWNATTEIWEFFSRHTLAGRRDTTTGPIDTTTGPIDTTTGPNDTTGTTGIGSILHNHLMISPNPATSNFTISMTHEMLMENTVQISLMDLTGRLVHRRDYPATEHIQIGISNIPTGMYQVILQSTTNEALPISTSLLMIE